MERRKGEMERKGETPENAGGGVRGKESERKEKGGWRVRGEGGIGGRE